MKGNTMADQPVVKTYTQVELDELLKKQESDLENSTGRAIAGLQTELKTISEQAETHLRENVELKKELAELRAGQPASGQRLVGLPAIGQKVAYFNHAGVQELGEVIGHGFKGVHLFIQGGHPNDKYERKEVEPGGPGKPNTFAHPPADKI